MTAVDVDRRCMTTAAVSQLTGIKAATLRAWRARGMGPASFRANGVVLYRQVVVEAWIDEQEAASQPNQGRGTRAAAQDPR